MGDAVSVAILKQLSDKAVSITLKFGPYTSIEVHWNGLLIRMLKAKYALARIISWSEVQDLDPAVITSIFDTMLEEFNKGAKSCSRFG